MSFPAITSPGNERIKRAVRLRRGTHRREEGLTLVDGARELAAALAAGVAIRQIYFCCGESAGETLKKLLKDASQQGAEVFEVSESVAQRLAYGERRDGVWGVVVPPERSLKDLKLPAQPLVAVLEGVEKPGNMGAVVRSADAAGVSAVVVADGGTDLFNPNAIRASLGTIFRVPVCAAATTDVVAWARKKQLQLVAARLDGTATPWDVDLTQPTALLLGAEAKGLSGAWNQADVQAIRLPMQGIADSLNVSATAAVLFYEALRQRLAKA
jgi:TrmH family RNA methyltransferase